MGMSLARILGTALDVLFGAREFCPHVGDWERAFSVQRNAWL